MSRRSMTRNSPWLPSPSQLLLLRAALLEGDEAAAAWGAWLRAPTLDEGSARLLPLVYRSLKGNDGADAVPAALAGVYRKTWALNRQRVRELRRVLDELADHSIDALLLKGVPLALLAYRDLGARPMADTDLLVRPEQAEQALAVLAELGYVSALGRPEELVGIRHGDELVDGAGRRIDLHWFSLQEACWPGADDEFWRGSIELELDGGNARALCPTDQLLHVLVHGSRWSLVQPLAWLADAAVLLETNRSDLDWDRLVRETEKRSVSTPVVRGLGYLKKTFAPWLPERAYEQLASLPIRRLERIEYRVKRRRHPILGTLPALWFDYGRLPKLSRRSLGFARYLQVTFRLSSHRQLLAEVARLACRRLAAVATLRRAPEE